MFGGLLGVSIPGGRCDPGDVASNAFCDPLVPLSNDVTLDMADLDGPFLEVDEATASGLRPTPIDGAVLYRAGLQELLTDPQEALLGCGRFYGAYCDGHGIGLLNSEASALVQSLLSSEETLGTPDVPTTIDAAIIQPGTVGFEGSPACTRFESDQSFILPGCRGLVDVGADGVPDTLDEILAGTSDDTFDPGYDPSVDGTTTSAGVGFTFPAQPRRQPFTGQYFRSEMSVLSWNAVMSLVALSTPPTMVLDPSCTPTPTNDCMIPTDNDGDGWADPQFIAQGEFDITRPFRTDGCSFATPYACSNVAAFRAILTQELDDDPSGPPQQRWVWETGAEHLQTDVATGGLADFADWTFHALGPEVSRRDSRDEAGVLFVLGPPDEVQTVPDSPLVVRGPGPDGLVGTEDDPFVGLAYGVVPEPSQVLLHLAALLAAAGIARCRTPAAPGGPPGRSPSPRLGPGCREAGRGAGSVAEPTRGSHSV